ncbi:hypothetical protein [Exiguobacterium sp. s151]|uniref:hypothetical protein n=1 Tax=Exiguobacterium sp. s151 TaxID=2751229 RepID=UPI001BED22D9|nr:hypothetical protein [Exiguobacterium sp. s151]
MEFLRVEYQDIERLTDRELTELLSMLLYFEADKSGISLNSVGVALNITVADGGEDGRIKWDGAPVRTNWLPSNFTLFQCKATDMPPAKCKEEILTRQNELKPRVREVFEQGGSYILFHNRTLNEQQIIERISNFQQAINESTNPIDIDSVDIKIYDAAKIAAWTNESISAVVTVWKWVGKHLPYGVRNWKEWSGYQDNSCEYVVDNVLESYINQLRQHLNGTKKVARIVGLSGVGKTRLAFETFRPSASLEDIEQNIRNIQMVYLDAAENSFDLPGLVSTWRGLSLRGTIIVDNCTPELHSKLLDEIEHKESQLNLLTLDYNPQRHNLNHPFIEIKQVSNEIIQGIITQAYPGISEADSERIIEFSQGFPKIAVLLAKARINQDDDIGSLRDDVLVDKLLWGRNIRDSMKHKVISACALFEHLGYEADVSIQWKYTTEHICRISEDDFYESVQYFLERGILDKRGRYIRVTPLPLAIRLATDWWKNCSPERAFEIVTAEMPEGMAEALCDQIAKLHFLPKAKELTLSLCGEQAPFGQAEVLNSEKGSRLFRSLVEVNPEATVNTLERVFGQMSIDELRKVGPGRRNLVWALEKLCFWERTFEPAARTLILFAAAENESWGNNATGQFLQLFHYILSGTQADLNTRLNVIDYAINSDIKEIRLLGIEALGHALKTHHFSRAVGVEMQGSRPVQLEWTPKVWEDVFEYWRKSLERLTFISIDDIEMSSTARKKITDNMRGLVSYGRMDELENSLKSISENIDVFWIEALVALNEVIKYEGPKIPDEEKERLHKWVEWMKPTNFSDRLQMIVSTPTWDHTEDPISGEYKDVSREAAIEFAKETVNIHYQEFLEKLSCVLYGEQRQSYFYGYELIKHVDKPEELLSQIMSSISDLIEDKVRDINIKFLGGVLASLQENNSKLVRDFLDEISENRLFSPYTVELTRFILIQEEDLSRMIKLLEEQKIIADDLISLSYGSVLNHLPPEVVLSFVSKIRSGTKDGLAIAWHILFMYSHGSEERFSAVSELLKSMLLNPELIMQRRVQSFEIVDVIKKIHVVRNGEEGVYFTLITQMIINILNERPEYNLSKDIRVYLKTIMTINWSDTWPILSSALLSTNKRLVFNLVDIIGPDMLNRNDWLLSMVPHDVLKAWCREHIEGAELLSSIVPVDLNQTEPNESTQIIEFLIHEYGDNEKVLRNISSRLNNFSWTGSLIPYYEKQVDFYKKFESVNFKVRSWAEKNIQILLTRIEEQREREEERDLGLY